MRPITGRSTILPNVREAEAGKTFRPPYLLQGVLIILKAASIGGSILGIIAWVIALLKWFIAFVGFLAFAIKILIVLAFIATFAAVVFMLFRSWQSMRKTN